MAVGIDSPMGWGVILKMAPGELLIWKLLEKNKSQPFFQASVIWSVVFSKPLWRTQLNCVGVVCPPVLGQRVSEAGTL